MVDRSYQVAVAGQLFRQHRVMHGKRPESVREDDYSKTSWLACKSRFDSRIRVDSTDPRCVVGSHDTFRAVDIGDIGRWRSPGTQRRRIPHVHVEPAKIVRITREVLLARRVRPMPDGSTHTERTSRPRELVNLKPASGPGAGAKKSKKDTQRSGVRLHRPPPLTPRYARRGSKASEAVRRKRSSRGKASR